MEKDLRRYLEKPFERLDVIQIDRQPDLELLKWLPSLVNETGLYFMEGKWFVVKASELGIPSWLLPLGADILIHSHEATEDIRDDGSIPSIRDYLNCSPKAENLIVSNLGITQYWRPETNEQFQKLEWADERGLFLNIVELQAYLNFLESLKLKYIIIPWEEIDEEKLMLMLKKEAEYWDYPAS